MIIIGDKDISYDRIVRINSIRDIQDTPANSTVLFAYDKEMMSYCMKNNVNYAVQVGSATKAIYANSLNARYILPNNNQLNEIQKVAENYMFDSKIIATITNEDEINSLALKEIDGVIFKEFLI